MKRPMKGQEVRIKQAGTGTLLYVKNDIARVMTAEGTVKVPASDIVLESVYQEQRAARKAKKLAEASKQYAVKKDDGAVNDLHRQFREGCGKKKHKKMVGEGYSNRYTIEVSPASARRALDILNDQFRGEYETGNGTNFYKFADGQVAYDASMEFERHGVDIIDVSPQVYEYEDDDAPTWDRSSGEDDDEYDIDEAGPARINHVYGRARSHAQDRADDEYEFNHPEQSLDDFKKSLKRSKNAKKEVDEADVYNPDDDGLERELNRPESNRPTSLADLDVEEGDTIEFYYSKHTPRMPATVTGFEDGKVVVTIDNGTEFRLNWTHEAVLAETLDEEQLTYLNDKGKKVTGRVAKRSTNSPKGYFLDTGEFVSQQRVIAKGSLGESFDLDSVMDAYMTGGFRGLGEYLGMDEHRASALYDEVAANHNLHPDDDYEEIIDIMAREALGESNWRDQLKSQKERYAQDKSRSPNARIYSKPSPNTARRRSVGEDIWGQDGWNFKSKMGSMLGRPDYKGALDALALSASENPGKPISGLAFDVARQFRGVEPRALADEYESQHGITEEQMDPARRCYEKGYNLAMQGKTLREPAQFAMKLGVQGDAEIAECVAAYEAGVREGRGGQMVGEVSQELLGRAADAASAKWHGAMNSGIAAQKRRDVKGMDAALGQAKKRSRQADKFKQAELDKRFARENSMRINDIIREGDLPDQGPIEPSQLPKSIQEFVAKLFGAYWKREGQANVIPYSAGYGYTYKNSAGPGNTGRGLLRLGVVGSEEELYANGRPKDKFDFQLGDYSVSLTFRGNAAMLRFSGPMEESVNEVGNQRSVRSLHTEYRDPLGNYHIVYNQEKGLYLVKPMTKEAERAIEPSAFHTLDDAIDHAEMELEYSREDLDEVSKSMLNRYKRAARSSEDKAGRDQFDARWNNEYYNDSNGDTGFRHMDDWSDEDREAYIQGGRTAKKRRKGLAIAQAKTAKHGKNLGSGKMRGYKAKVRATDESLGESDDDGPFYALVIFGPESKKKKIKFANQAQFEKWSEKHDGNYELLSFQDIDESLEENKLLKVSKLSSAEYQRAKKLKGFDKSTYTWDSSDQLYHKKAKNESEELDEAGYWKDKFGNYSGRDKYARMGADAGANDEGWENEPKEKPKTYRSSNRGNRETLVKARFYNVKPEQEQEAENMGLTKTKNGKWMLAYKQGPGYSTRDWFEKNVPRADEKFGPGKDWTPKK